VLERRCGVRILLITLFFFSFFPFFSFLFCFVCLFIIIIFFNVISFPSSLLSLSSYIWPLASAIHVFVVVIPVQTYA